MFYHTYASTHYSLHTPAAVYSSLDALGDRVLPLIPPFHFGADRVLPYTHDNGCQQDLPIPIYRRFRLLRALGELPRSRVLPGARLPPDLAVSIGVARTGQYRGDFSATVWNGQAFFCSDPAKFQSKICYTKRLLDRVDLLLICETHGTDGGNKSWRPPIGSSAWWSAGPTIGHAGVGILVKDSFLKKFVEKPKWTVIWPGRAAILSLRGPEGSLDVIVSYFHTGGQVNDLDRHGVHPDFYDYCCSFPRLRERLRTRIGQAIEPKEQVIK